AGDAAPIRRVACGALARAEEDGLAGLRVSGNLRAGGCRSRVQRTDVADQRGNLVLWQGEGRHLVSALGDDGCDIGVRDRLEMDGADHVGSTIRAAGVVAVTERAG